MADQRLKSWSACLVFGWCAYGCADAQRDAHVPALVAPSRPAAASPVTTDLADVHHQAKQRRERAVAETRRGNAQAALEMIELGIWNEMAQLAPLAEPLLAWRERVDEVRPGIQLRQLWGDLAANWAVRQTDLSKERLGEILVQARACLDQAGTTHPILLHELAWLLTDAQPADPERAGRLMIQVRDACQTMAASPDGGVQAHRLMIHSELVERSDDCLRLLAAAGDDAIGDPLARFAALQRWLSVWTKGRSVPQLDVPFAERHGAGARIGGGDKRARALFPDRIVRMAGRCGDSAFEAEVCWSIVRMLGVDTSIVPVEFITAWAERAAQAATLSGDRVVAARATALWLASVPANVDLGTAEWRRRLTCADAALKDLIGSKSRDHVRLHTFRGLALSRVQADGALAAFQTASVLLTQQDNPPPSVRESPWASSWLALARHAALVQPGPGDIHELAIAAFSAAEDGYKYASNPALRATCRRELARFSWNDDAQTQRDAVMVYRWAAAGFAEAGKLYWAEEESTLVELAERLRQAGDDIQAMGCLLDAAAAWRARSTAAGDAHQLHAEELERKAGLRRPAANERVEIDSTRDATQGPWVDALTSLIGRLETAPDAIQRTSVYQLILRFFHWPGGNHRLDREHRLAMAAEWHLSSDACRRLAVMALKHDNGLLMQVVDAAGHRPLAPVLAAALRQAERKEFGAAAAEAYQVLTADDPALAGQLAATAIALTWGDPCQAVIRQAASVLPPERFIALCRDLVTQSQGENRGILSHLINILARAPSTLPVADLRRLADTAEWRDDRAEALWALALLGDASLEMTLPRLLADRAHPFIVQAYALDFGVHLRLAAITPAIGTVLSERNPDSDRVLLHPKALIGALALGMPLDQSLILDWMRADWGNDPDPATLALEGPVERYRILSAALTRWLTTQDAEAWRIIEHGVAHEWQRYRVHVITDAGLSRHPKAFAALMAIAKLDELMKSVEPDVHARAVESYLRALSHLDLDTGQHEEVKRRFGQTVPPPAPPLSPRFNRLTRPCDGGPSAPLWPPAIVDGAGAAPPAR